jgi:hypothetical protein
VPYSASVSEDSVVLNHAEKLEKLYSVIQGPEEEWQVHIIHCVPDYSCHKRFNKKRQKTEKIKINLDEINSKTLAEMCITNSQ